MDNIPVIVTTSDAYHHCLRVWIYMFRKNWGMDQPVEIVGYKEPEFALPENYTFHSLGKQVGGPANFTTDLRRYFETQPEWLYWSMEDSWHLSVNYKELDTLKSLRFIKGCGKINVTTATVIQDHTVFGEVDGMRILENSQTSRYRLATQPSLWRRDYLLKYMTPGLSPWQMETQQAHNDGCRIFGADHAVVKITEGVTKHNIYKLNLHGIPKEQIQEMEELGILNNTMTYERPG